MCRTAGAKDKQKRTRRKATEAELAAKATKRNAAAAAKRLADQAAAEATKKAFFATMAGAASSSRDAAAANNGSLGGGCEAESAVEPGVGSSSSSAPHAEAPRPELPETRQEARPADVEAELDDEENEEDENGSSVMGVYLKAVFHQLKSETSSSVRERLEALHDQSRRH